MGRLLSQAAVALVTALAATIFVAASVGFLGVAGYLLLVPRMPEPLAALSVALIGVVIAGLIVLVARYALRPGRTGRGIASNDTIRTDDINDMAAALGGIAARELSQQAQSHPYHAVAIALLAGLAAGASPQLREFLMGAGRN